MFGLAAMEIRSPELLDGSRNRLQSQHRYIRIGSHRNKSWYVSLRHNPLLLAWLLIRSAKAFGLWGLGVQNALNSCKLLCRGFAVLACQYLFRLLSNEILELPVSGHLSLKVHNGYKVFDLHRRVVTKIFSPKVTLDQISDEIDWARRVGTHSFAPTVRRWNVEDRWYEEDYVNGCVLPLTTRSVFLLTFHEAMPPQLAPIILAFSPREVKALEYAQGRHKLLLGIQSQLAEKRLDATKIQRVWNFSRVMIERVQRAGNCLIFLAFSHGDFSRQHTFITEHGPVHIDWEMGGYRTALYDLHDAFFKRLQSELVPPDVTLVLAQAISRLQLCLSQQASVSNVALISSLQEAEVYRWIYYVERICFFLGGSNDMSDQKLNKMLLSIDAFNSYEARLLERRDQTFSTESAREQLILDVTRGSNQ